MDFSRNLLSINFLFLGSFALLISACGSHPTEVYQTKILDSDIGFYVSDNPDYRKGEGKFFARVDSSNSRIYYSFQHNYIFKTYTDKNINVYTLVSDEKDVLALTLIDSLVLKKADKLLDSLGYNNLKRSAGTTGFIIEVAGH